MRVEGRFIHAEDVASYKNIADAYGKVENTLERLDTNYRPAQIPSKYNADEFVDLNIVRASKDMEIESWKLEFCLNNLKSMVEDPFIKEALHDIVVYIALRKSDEIASVEAHHTKLAATREKSIRQAVEMNERSEANKETKRAELEKDLEGILSTIGARKQRLIKSIDKAMENAHLRGYDRMDGITFSKWRHMGLVQNVGTESKPLFKPVVEAIMALTPDEFSAAMDAPMISAHDLSRKSAIR